MRASLGSSSGPKESAMNPIISRGFVSAMGLYGQCAFPLTDSSPTSRNTANSTDSLGFSRNYIQLHELEEHQGNLHVICIRVGICSQKDIGNVQVIFSFICYCCTEGCGILLSSSGFLFPYECN